MVKPNKGGLTTEFEKNYIDIWMVDGKLLALECRKWKGIETEAQSLQVL